MALTIQERLKDLRVERGFTLEQPVDETGISKSALGNYESNDFKEISSQAIIKLAKAYKVTADYLLGLTEKKSNSEVYVTDLNLTDEVIEILRNKQNHKGRSDSAPKNSAVNEIQKDLEEALNFKGSRTEQMLMVFCKQMKIKYEKLTEKEKKTLIDIASKSKLIKSYIPQRGKKKK